MDGWMRVTSSGDVDNITQGWSKKTSQAKERGKKCHLTNKRVVNFNITPTFSSLAFTGWKRAPKIFCREERMENGICDLISFYKEWRSFFFLVLLRFRHSATPNGKQNLAKVTIASVCHHHHSNSDNDKREKKSNWKILWNGNAACYNQSQWRFFLIKSFREIFSI